MAIGDSHGVVQIINVVECKLACVWNISIHMSSLELVIWFCMLV